MGGVSDTLRESILGRVSYSSFRMGIALTRKGVLTQKASIPKQSGDHFAGIAAHGNTRNQYVMITAFPERWSALTYSEASR